MTEKNSSRFSRWFYGEEDPLLGRVEMQPQKEYVEKYMIWSITRSSYFLIRPTV